MLRYLLFDLDNTLYPEILGLEHEVVRRMTAYVADWLDISPEEAVERRRTNMVHYGTTLEWLVKAEGFTDVEGFFAAAHPEGEEDPLSPDPALGALLDSIDLPKAVFTNAPMEHATRILHRLGVTDRFEGIYDIRFNGLSGKPHRAAYERVCAACGVKPAECMFVDDVPRYVHGFLEAGGGRGILIDELDRHGASPLTRIHSLLELPAIIECEGIDRIQPGLF